MPPHSQMILTVKTGSFVEIGPLIRMIKLGITTIDWEDGLPALACTKDGSALLYSGSWSPHLFATGRTGSVLAFSQEIDSIKAHLATLKPDEVTAYVEERLDFKRKVNKVSLKNPCAINTTLVTLHDTACCQLLYLVRVSAHRTISRTSRGPR